MNQLMANKATTTGLLFTCLIVSMMGCVRRRLLVRSDPPGALVSVDNIVIGQSPAASPFLYYGTRDIRLERDGYETQTLRHKINPPWYQLPPIDFIAETLWPFEVRDERIIDTKLVPKREEPAEVIAGRGDQLRSQARSGITTSLPPTALPPAPTPLPQPAPIQTLPFGGVPAEAQ